MRPEERRRGRVTAALRPGLRVGLFSPVHPMTTGSVMGGVADRAWQTRPHMRIDDSVQQALKGGGVWRYSALAPVAGSCASGSLCPSPRKLGIHYWSFANFAETS